MPPEVSALPANIFKVFLGCHPASSDILPQNSPEIMLYENFISFLKVSHKKLLNKPIKEFLKESQKKNRELLLGATTNRNTKETSGEFQSFCWICWCHS